MRQASLCTEPPIAAIIIWFLHQLSSPIFVSSESVAETEMQTIETTEAFYTEYRLNRIAGQFNQTNFDAIEVSASLAGYPDLPRWIAYYRRAGSANGFFYGTPDTADDGDFDIEIVLLDRQTFDTNRDHLRYRILSRNVTYRNQVQIKLFDLDIEDYIRQNISAAILEIFRRSLWRADDVYITRFARPIDIGGRFPADPREKEGVIVRVGSGKNFTEELTTLESEATQMRRRVPCPKRYKTTTAEYLFRERNLRVDWCRFGLRGGATSAAAFGGDDFITRTGE